MSNENNSLTWQDRLRYEFRRNKSKSVILTILLVVGVAMVLRLVTKKPPTAEAQSSELVAAAPAMPAGPEPMPATSAKGRPGEALVDAGADSGASAPRPKAPVTTKVEFVRDIFRPDPAVFIAKDQPEAVSADDARTQVRLEANTLRLTSTMVGEVSCATINGQLLKINDWIEGFQVVSIGKGSCLVVKKGVRVQLDMDN